MSENQIKIVQSDKRGQIVIPLSVRKKLNLEDGSAFWVIPKGDSIILKKVAPPK